MNIIDSIVANGHGSIDPSYVVIHETANPGATAANHRDYWSRDGTYAVHYVADWTGDVYHTVPDDRMCWQVGYGNDQVIGIELCHATNQADFDAMWKTGVEWARWMLDKMGWGTDRLISHDTARVWWGGTDHTDPLGYFAEFGKSWDDFVSDVEQGSTKTMGLRTGAVEAWPDYRSAWRLTKESDDYPGGLYSLRNCHTGQAIAACDPIGSGTGVVMADYSPGTFNQSWAWSHSDAGDHGLTQAGHFLSALNGNFALMSTGGGVDVWAIYDWRWEHNWSLVPAIDGCYRIVNYDGACLRV